MERAIVCAKHLQPIFFASIPKNYSYCYSPKPGGPCACPTIVPSPRGRLEAPYCGPKPVAYNPCKPMFTTSIESTKYKLIFFLLCVPLIIAQMFRAFGHEMPPKDECREYEYMRRRTKRFPWGDGNKSLFHNDHANSLPAECKPPPADYCD